MLKGSLLNVKFYYQRAGIAYFVLEPDTENDSQVDKVTST